MLHLNLNITSWITKDSYAKLTLSSLLSVVYHPVNYLLSCGFITQRVAFFTKKNLPSLLHDHDVMQSHHGSSDVQVLKLRSPRLKRGWFFLNCRPKGEKKTTADLGLMFFCCQYPSNNQTFIYGKLKRHFLRCFFFGLEVQLYTWMMAA